MIYEQSHQYIRSTTSVGIHPAIYNAHLITARARHVAKENKSVADQKLLQEVMPKRRLLGFKD
ncbi:hypothetical protein N7448_007004 [Penicillium atrosanguineum]|uniref:Uncharacterized protein n=1 Tax=Penicillium atrosanguineum TaxID=1132637 RepID=A0A9W9PVT9_9EURO|nr:hypothetical protein N7448_007004 [Penicillium atrosanguineum]KAJ5308334.1 hypothetical protein N7476_008990 [Penicillium atrosanguineum]